MKPINFAKNILIGALAFSTFGNAFAGGPGVRGGGHVVDIDGFPEPIEFVKGTTCKWKERGEILKLNPEVKQLLNTLAQYDWYFSFELERELNYLTFCFTGPLVRLTPVDPQSPVATTLMLGEKYRQAAVRLDSTVYVDEDIYVALRKKNPQRSATLIIHEALHSYLSMDLADSIRYLYLWTMSKQISLAGQPAQVPTDGSIADSTIDSRQALYDQMRLNHVDFPRRTDSLDVYKNEVKFLLGTPDYQTSTILAVDNPESLIADYDQFSTNLAPWDQEYVNNRGTKKILIDALISAMRASTQDQFQNILEKKYQALSPILIAISALNYLSPQKRELLLQSPVYQDALQQAYQHFNAMGITMGELHMVASPDLSIFAGGSASVNTSFTGLPFTIQSTLDIDVLIEVISEDIKEGKWDVIQSQVTENDEFYNAIGFEIQRQQIENITPIVVEEKDLAIKNIHTLASRCKSFLLEQIKERVNSQQFLKFQSLLRQEK